MKKRKKRTKTENGAKNDKTGNSGIFREAEQFFVPKNINEKFAFSINFH